MTRILKILSCILVTFGLAGASCEDHEPPPCRRLGEIRSMPMKDAGADEVYKLILAQPRDEAIPCLIEQITDTRVVRDPRESFRRQDGIAVGDLAVFVLMEITRQELAQVAPPERRDAFRANGIFEYFDFVQDPANRQSVQDWWRTWNASTVNTKNAK